MWKHLISTGNVLYVEGINQKGMNSDRAFFRAKDIMFLDTVGQARTKSITFRIGLEDIQPDTISAFSDCAKANPANTCSN